MQEGYPRRNAEQKQPRIVERMPGQQQRRAGAEQAAGNTPEALLITPPTVGKLTTAAEVIAQ